MDWTSSSSVLCAVRMGKINCDLASNCLAQGRGVLSEVTPPINLTASSKIVIRLQFSSVVIPGTKCMQSPFFPPPHPLTCIYI